MLPFGRFLGLAKQNGSSNVVTLSPFFIYKVRSHDNIIYILTVVNTDHFVMFLMFLFLFVHLNQISHRTTIKSLIQSHTSVLYFRSGQVVR